MPFYYDVNRAITTNGSAGTETVHYRFATTSNQESARIVGIFVASRFGTAGGAQIRFKTNTGSAASGGTSETPAAKNLRSPAAGITAFNDTSTITAGGTLKVRMSVGFAQTGGTGGWVPLEPADAIQMMPGASNPVGSEAASIATSTSVTADLTIEIAEGA